MTSIMSENNFNYQSKFNPTFLGAQTGTILFQNFDPEPFKSLIISEVIDYDTEDTEKNQIKKATVDMSC